MRPIEEIEFDLNEAYSREQVLMNEIRSAQERLREHNQDEIIPLLEELAQAREEANHGEKR